jgi:membrane protein
MPASRHGKEKGSRKRERMSDRLHQPSHGASPATRPRRLAKFILLVYRNFMLHQGLENAKSLTFTSLFAVVPLLTLMLSLFTLFPSFQDLGTSIQELLLKHLLPSSGQELEAYIEEFTAQAHKLTWLGAVLLFVTGVLMLRSIESCFNRIWGVPEMRKGVLSFVLYWLATSLGPLLLGVGLVLSSYLSSLSLFERFSELSGMIGARSAVLEFFPAVLAVGAFTLLYMTVPNCGVKARDALVGAAVVVLILHLVKWVFTLSITTASYQLVYGTFAALPIFLLWLYVCWTVILGGANLVRCLPFYPAP